MSLISAVTSRGHMRFMIKEKGGVNADVFIEFLRRLMVGSKNKIFLIVDRMALAPDQISRGDTITSRALTACYTGPEIWHWHRGASPMKFQDQRP
jgi:hypothetical protein